LSNDPHEDGQAIIEVGTREQSGAVAIDDGELEGLGIEVVDDIQGVFRVVADGEVGDAVRQKRMVEGVAAGGCGAFVADIEAVFVFTEGHGEGAVALDGGNTLVSTVRSQDHLTLR
jgi:hypothetical protein